MLFLMSARLHEAIYKSFVDTLGVFTYIDGRRSDIALIERQFYDRL
jgi:hypothetical protein